MKKILYIVFLITFTLSFGQEVEKEDLKVGLVLSGGGAKGLAHIGALKVIEKAGVRIDYIGGTSMGAIIGALYASGYSANQLDSIFNKTDFGRLIQDEIPRSAKTFYEKEESDRYALVLPFDNFKVGFPSGLSKGQNIYNLLSKLTSHVQNVEDFSKLPIPFLCIATDVETVKEIVLEKGDLSRAATASGALPTLFSPVTIGDKVFIDGGVVNNYPVDEVRAKGMDVIIGIDVQDGLKDRGKLKSAIDVLLQINSHKTIDDMVAKKEKTDIYIHPDINDFTVISFEDGKKIIGSGTDETSLYIRPLKELASRQQKHAHKKVVFEKNDFININDVLIEGNENYTRAYIMGKLKLRTPAKITYKNFSDGINNLSATGNFQDINYRVEQNQEGLNTLILTVQESNSKMLLRLGVHYDDLYRAAALINITRKRLFTNNDIASIDVILGDNIRYDFNYYIDKGFYWSVGFNSQYTYFDKNVSLNYILPDLPPNIQTSDNSGLNKLELKYSDFTNRIYVETLFKRVFSLSIGGEHKYLRYLSETIGIDPNNLSRTIFESTNYYSIFGQLKFDTFDNTFFPNKGLYFNGDFHLYLFGQGRNNNFQEFSIAKAKLGYATSFARKFSVVFTSEGGFKIGGDETQSLDFSLGGYGFKEVNNILPMYGYEALSLRGNTYLKTDLTLDFEFIRKNHINISGNIANVGDDLFTNRGWIDRVNYTGIAIGYGLESFMGPLELKYSYSPDLGESIWYVALGYRF